MTEHINTKAIIFDLDGVICSTDEYHYKAWKRMADRLKLPFNEEINHRLRGISRRESLELILSQGEKEYTEEEKEILEEEKNRYYQQLLNEMSNQDLIGEVKEVLLELRQLGYLLAIGSSSKNAKLILKKTGLQDFFDAIADGTDITRSKPDPEVFLIAAQKLHVLPENCMVVEDAVAGAAAAHAAQMTAVCVGDAAQKEAGDYNLKSISLLTGLLEVLPVSTVGKL